MRRTIAILAVLIAGCDTASVPLASSQADAEGKTFAAPPPGQGAIYIVRGGDAGTLLSIVVGSRNLGPLGNYTWFRQDVAPGTVPVRCTGGESSQIVDVAVAAGELRFLQVRPTTGWAALRCAIAEIPPDQGRQIALGGKRARALD